MRANQVVVKGVVRPNGALELEGKPHLPVGPVEVVVRPLPVTSPSSEDWWQYLQRARRELEAMNYPFMNDEEAMTWIEELRSDDDRVEEAYRTAGDSHR